MPNDIAPTGLCPGQTNGANTLSCSNLPASPTSNPNYIFVIIIIVMVIVGGFVLFQMLRKRKSKRRDNP